MNKIIRFFTIAFLFTALAVNAAPLEIVNKSTDEIRIDIGVNNKVYLSAAHVFPGRSFFAEVPNEPIDIEIEVQTPASMHSSPQYRFTTKSSANSKPKYLNWSPKEKPKTLLCPQSTKYFGLSSKSHSGQDLKNNISQNEIMRK